MECSCVETGLALRQVLFNHSAALLLRSLPHRISLSSSCIEREPEPPTAAQALQTPSTPSPPPFQRMSTTPHLSYSQPATRMPPPTGSPPSYAKIYPYSLRPMILVSTIVSFFYLIIFGIASLKAIGYNGETAKLKTFDAVTGALFIGAATIEVFGFVAAWTVSRKDESRTGTDTVSRKSNESRFGRS